MRRDRFARLRLLVLPALLAALTLACGFLASGARVTNAVMALATQGDEVAPGSITDTYAPDQGKFNVVVSVATAPRNTKLKAVWTAPDAKVHTTETTVEGTRSVVLSVARENAPWTPGTYKVDIYLDGKVAKSLTFKVVGVVAPPTVTPTVTATPTRAPTVTATPTRPLPTPTRPAGTPTTAPTRAAATPIAVPRPVAFVSGITMCRSIVGGTNEPRDVTSTFDGVAALHAVVSIADAPAGTRFMARWQVTDVGDPAQRDKAMGDYALTSDGTRNLDFNFKPDTSLPPGAYRVELLVNGALDRIQPFWVTKPSGIITGVTMARSATASEKAPVDPTTTFDPAATIHAVVQIAKAPANTALTARWYVTDIGDAAQRNQLIDENTARTDGDRNVDFTLAPTNKWPAGTYRVEVSVNGVLEQVVHYTVK